MRSNLTLADARDLDFAELVERAEEILAEFDREQVETEAQRLQRLSRTLDEMPQVYRWLLMLQAWCDHWTDSTAQMFGHGDNRYKALRQRRDFFKSMASAAKQRYESASRQITIIQGFTPDGMPRARREQS